MSYGIGYAGAESDYNEADVVIFGIPYDHTSCFKAGAREAPTAIRRASYNFEEIHFEHGIHQPQEACISRKVFRGNGLAVHGKTQGRPRFFPVSACREGQPGSGHHRRGHA